MISINSDSIGGRIVVGLAILTLCVEMLTDDGCMDRRAPIMDLGVCEDFCIETGVRRVDGYACECQHVCDEDHK